MMKEEQSAEMNKLIKKMKRIFAIIGYWYFEGNFVKSLEYIEQEELLIKNLQGDLPEEIKAFHALWLWFRAIIYAYRGNLAHSFEAANELLRVGELHGNKRGISYGIFELGRYYWLSGDLDKALVHLDHAIRLCEEILNDISDFIMLAGQLDLAIIVSVAKEDQERAKKYFKRLEEIRALKPEDLVINDMYRLAKADLLKLSMNFRDRAMAEDLFREIIDEERPHFIIKLRILSELCELLLVELRFSNDIKIISEIKPLLEKLSSMALYSGLYYYLIEVYILRGKLALIMFDMEGSRRHLTEAQNMAEKYGYIRLANEIASLHEAMMEKKDTWKQMEKRNAPLSERMDLARLDDHLKGKFRMRMMKMERAAEPPPKKEVF
jgi:tetratricopeptide (TPR) repeat protein